MPPGVSVQQYQAYMQRLLVQRVRAFVTVLQCCSTVGGERERGVGGLQCGQQGREVCVRVERERGGMQARRVQACLAAGGGVQAGYVCGCGGLGGR